MIFYSTLKVLVNSSNKKTQKICKEYYYLGVKNKGTKLCIY